MAAAVKGLSLVKPDDARLKKEFTYLMAVLE